MGAIDQLGIIDYRNQLARASWSIGTRAKTLYFTVHYNGPPVAAFGYPPGELDQLEFDATYHMRPGVISSGGADGIQYHGATLSDGSNYQCRDWSAMLWHCGNAEGNSYSLSWHLPIGDGQQPTPAQYTSLTRVIDAFRADFDIVAVNVKNHKDWKNTACPGAYLTPYVIDYRTAHTPPQPLVWYRTIYNANCRQAPDVASPVVMVTPAGTVFGVDAVIEDGAPYNGETTYVHRADHLGFYHLSVVAPA